jgi:alkanesulfonate monooxygenase SsuD/methylene tetrahydromethanopterin reductase-like flavin-dependent oxidoreductase (luciferase family)
MPLLASLSGNFQGRSDAQESPNMESRRFETCPEWMRRFLRAFSGNKDGTEGCSMLHFRTRLQLQKPLNKSHLPVWVFGPMEASSLLLLYHNRVLIPAWFTEAPRLTTRRERDTPLKPRYPLARRISRF